MRIALSLFWLVVMLFSALTVLPLNVESDITKLISSPKLDESRKFFTSQLISISVRDSDKAHLIEKLGELGVVPPSGFDFTGVAIINEELRSSLVSPEKMAKRTARLMYSPVTLYNLATDPLLLQAEVSPPSTTLLTMELPRNSTMLVPQIDSIVKSFKEAEWTGPVRFAESSEKRLRADINRVSTLGSIGIALVTLFIFRSSKQLFLSLLSVGIGLLFGTWVTSFVFGSIHMLTLGIGAGLIGACVDYSMHFLCEKLEHEDVFRRALVPISLGALTSIIAFLSLLLTPFPGLREISVFASAGLSASAITVLLWFPYLIGRSSGDPSFILNLAEKFTKLSFLNTKSLLLILIVSGIGTFYVEFDDDIRLLQKPEMSLIEVEKKINPDTPKILMVPKSSNLKSFEAKLSPDKHLGVFPDQEGLILEFISNHFDRYKKELNKYGIVLPGNVSSYTSSNPFETESYYVIPYFGEELRDLSENFNVREEISSLFKHYRLASIKAVSVAYLLIWFLLCFRYGVKGGTLAFLPSVATAFTTIVTVDLLGFHLNFFSLLALIIVLGLCIDYAIFLKESSSRAVKLSVLLSTTTSLISFGLLTLSSTELLSSFGAVITVGVLYSQIFSASVTNLRRDTFN